MKKISIFKFLSLLWVMLILPACLGLGTVADGDDSPVAETSVQFSLQRVDQTNANVLFSNEESNIPTKVLIKYRLKGNTTETTTSVDLTRFGDSYVTGSTIPIEEGTYELLRFDVLDKYGCTIYSTPMSGSYVANHINISTPLAYEFSVGGGKINAVTVQVVKVEEDTNPADFGFPAFTFEPLDYNKFYIKVLILDEDTCWEYTSANLEIQDGDAQVVENLELRNKVNRILINEYDNYFLIISKLGYSTKYLYVTESELLQFTVDEPLQVKLRRDEELITREQLVAKIASGEDVSNANVSFISDMSYLMESVAAYLGQSVDNCPIVQNFNQDISSWDVSSVTDMSYMFHCATSFDQNISGWITSKVTNMEHMFDGAEAFDRDISGWLVNNVTGFSSFDDNSSANWIASEKPRFVLSRKDLVEMIAKEKDVTCANVSAITDMSYLMDSVAAYTGKSVDKSSAVQNFNQDISSWDVSNVTDMSYMFYYATSFNQNLGSWGAKVSNVVDMSHMFENTEIFNQDISGWDVSNVTDMSYMFHCATSFDQNISGWITSKVTNMEHMFDGAEAFDQNIYDWDVSSISVGFSTSFDENTSSNWTADEKPKFKISRAKLVQMIAEEKDVTYANVSAITDMSYLMDSVAAYTGKSIDKSRAVQDFNQDISNWDVSNVTDMSYMFYYATSFNQNLGNWGAKVSNVVNMSHMFDNAEAFDQDISNWDVLDIPIGNFTGFDDNTSASWEYYEKPNFKLTRDQLVVRIAEEKDVTTANVSAITDMSRLMDSVAAYLGQTVTNCPVVQNFNQNISSWNVSNVTNMSRMFYRANSFDQDLSSWDVSNVTDISYMFYVTSFNHDINSWDVSNVTNMSGIFFFASSFNQNLDNWDVSNVTNMSLMFCSARAFNQNISNWDVSKVTNMYSLFKSASSFNQNISNWDVSNVTNMSWMFYSAIAFNQDISNWDVSNVTNMSWMFYYAIAFNQDISSWDVSNVTNMSSMFRSASSFNQDISSWGWDVVRVTDMSYMFFYATSFNQNLSRWRVYSVTNYSNFDVGASQWFSGFKPDF